MLALSGLFKTWNTYSIYFDLEPKQAGAKLYQAKLEATRYLSQKTIATQTLNQNYIVTTECPQLCINVNKYCYFFPQLSSHILSNEPYFCKVIYIATLGSILDSQLSWESGKFQLILMYL